MNALPPLSKGQIVAKIKSAHDALMRALSSLTDNQMTQPGVENGWSIKDIMAHITSWEVHLADQVQAVIKNTSPEIPPILDWEDVHKRNADTYAANQHRPLGKVREEFNSRYTEMLLAINALDESDLYKPQPGMDPDAPPIWESIAEETYEHYAEHLASIQTWLGKRNNPG